MNIVVNAQVVELVDDVQEVQVSREAGAGVTTRCVAVHILGC